MHSTRPHHISTRHPRAAYYYLLKANRVGTALCTSDVPVHRALGYKGTAARLHCHRHFVATISVPGVVHVGEHRIINASRVTAECVHNNMEREESACLIGQ